MNQHQPAWRRLIRSLWPIGIRVQLMLWYTAVFALLLFLAGTILYIRLQTSLGASLDTNLELRAQQIAGGIGNKNGQITIQDVTGELPGFDANIKDQEIPRADVNYGVLVRVLDSKGQTFGATPAFHSLIVPLVSVSQPLRGKAWEATITSRDGQEVRLYSRALNENGKIFAVIQVGQSLSDIEHTLHSIAKELFVLGLFVLPLSAIGSYFLAARAFVPITHLTQTARRIKAGDLSQRVPVPRASDEINALALTLNEMIEHLEQAFVRQRRFVADASHELRTPVAAIRSKTDLALRHIFTPQEYGSVLRAINSETMRLGRLISDLLALARGDEGETYFEHEPVRLDLLANMVAYNAQPLADERRITLRVHAPEPVTILGDEARLIQVVMNLLDNAIVYTNVGGSVTLVVKTSQGYAQVVVLDTGIGIAAEHLPSIFERFYRVDPSRSRKEGGSSGLGLAIVDWVVRAHSGSVKVESEPGRGSTFTVWLPAPST